MAFARRLPGTADDVAALGDWFERQRERTRERAFARLFADYLDLPGVVESDYLHRIVEADGLRLLGGIRFYGRDVARPFVELIAWTPLDEERSGDGSTSGWHASIIERLCRIVARE